MGATTKSGSERRDPRSLKLTNVTEWESGSTRRVEDFLATEEPLEIRSGRQSLGVTMRTPGHDHELVVGFLFTDGIISRPEQLVSVGFGKLASPSVAKQNHLSVKLRAVKIPKHRTERMYSAGSDCGVCGKIVDRRRSPAVAGSPRCGHPV